MLMLDELGQIENRYDYTEYGRRAMGNSDRLAQVMVRKGIEQSNRATYAVGGLHLRLKRARCVVGRAIATTAGTRTWAAFGGRYGGKQ
jgi:hypothetical protein